MKNYRILLVLIFFPLIMSCQPSTKEAIKYNDGITEQQILVNEKVSILMESYDTYVSEEMDEAYNNAIEQLNKGVEYTNKLRGFEDDTYFTEGALVFFNSYKEVLENEHGKIIELLKLPADDYGTDQIQEYEMLRSQSNMKIDKAYEDMLIIQKKFAKKYHIELE
ncbi:MAG: hypothetical protein ABFS35_11695 [Bacteroidota bacterium]